MSEIFSFLEKLNNKKVAIIFAVIGMAIYANSLNNGFVGDDFPQIVDNPLIHSAANIPQLFTNGTSFDQNNVLRSDYYRPVFSTVLALIYSFSGDNPVLYHIIQIVFHIFNSVLVFLLFRRFLSKNIAFLIGLIFLVHPFNAETVIYISNLQDIMFVFFGLSALYLLTKNKLSNGSIILAGLLLLLSILSKETGIVFLFIATVFAIVYRRMEAGKILLPIGFSFVTYFAIRLFAVPIHISKTVMSPIMALDLWQRLSHIPKLFLFYIQSFLFPIKLSIYHSWTINSINFSNFFFPLLICLIIVGVIIYFAFKLKNTNNGLLTAFVFFSGWFVLGLAAHMQIIPLDQTVADRWFYLPIIGLLGIIGLLLQYLNLQSPKRLTLLVLVSGLIISFFSIRVIIRNDNWQTEEKLYKHDIQYNSDSFQLEKGLAIYASRSGNYAEAEKHYLKSAELFPSSYTYRGAGIFYLKNKQHDEAVKYLDLATDHDGSYTYNWLLLAVAKNNQGDKAGALSAAEKAYTLTPTPNVLSIINSIKNGQNIPVQ